VAILLMGYWYLGENPDKKLEAKDKLGDLRQRLGFGEYVNQTPLPIDGVVTFVDTRGNRFENRDIKVSIKRGSSEIYNNYINANSEIVLRDIFTWTLYNVSVVEGYGRARIYPLYNTGILFETNNTNVEVVVQERAFLKDLNVDVDTGHDYDDRILLDSADGKHIILFDLKASGKGIVKTPKLKITSEDMSNFDAWIWIYNTQGLELPESLEKGKVKIGEEYTFENLHERNGMKLALQVEKPPVGKFKITISDSEGLEKKSALFEVI
jgi:hypothetical protein